MFYFKISTTRDRNILKVSHSIVSEIYLGEMIEECYTLGNSIECIYLLQGLNDTYLVRSGEKKYIFRIYRYGRRTAESIQSEIEYISYLDGKSTLVAGPISDNYGNVLKTFECPEGVRYGFLMQCAANTEIESHCVLTGNSHNYGKSVARIHECSFSFKPKEKFTDIDFGHLIWEPISLIKKYFSSVDISYITAIAARVVDELTSLDCGGLTKSYIHGDLTGGNACLSSTNDYIFFDFDCCGYGWLSYDLSVFYWSSLLCQKDEKLWNDFIDGYVEINDLSMLDLSAIPLLAIARHFWIIGYSIEQMSVKGRLSYKLRDLEQDLAFFKVLESKQSWSS